MNTAYHLNDRHFAMALAISFGLHLILFAAWMAMPKEVVEEIPVRILNIKLGDGEELYLQPASLPEQTEQTEQAAPEPKPALREKSMPPEDITPPLEALPQPKKTPQIEKKPKPVEKPTPVIKTEAPRQEKPVAKTKEKTIKIGEALSAELPNQQRNVRSTAAPTANTTGEAGNGGTSATQTIITNYVQQVSSHLYTYKRYPQEVRGTPYPEVRGTVFIQFDRQGTLRGTPSITTSTSYQVFDRAMLEAARHANPYPAVPESYQPGQDIIAFNIPVIFTPADQITP